MNQSTSAQPFTYGPPERCPELSSPNTFGDTLRSRTRAGPPYGLPCSARAPLNGSFGQQKTPPASGTGAFHDFSIRGDFDEFSIGYD